MGFLSGWSQIVEGFFNTRTYRYAGVENATRGTLSESTVRIAQPGKKFKKFKRLY
jgi:hypothetical protein